MRGARRTRRRAPAARAAPAEGVAASKASAPPPKPRENAGPTPDAEHRAKRTDLMGVGSGPEQGVRLAQELRRQGHTGRWVAGSTVGDSEPARRMGNDGNGTVIPSTFYSGVSAKAKAFEDE